MSNKFNTHFLDDAEKMRDFYDLSKEEFLASYSYLTEEEYGATVAAFIKKMRPTETSVGIVTTETYDDGCAKGIKILLDNEIVCMLDVYNAENGEAEGEARVLVYKKNYGEDEEEAPIACIPINR